MKKKLISMLLVCAMAAGALAGCGGSSGGSSGGGAGAGTEKAVDAGTQEGGKDTIKIAVYSDFAGFDPYNSGMDLDKVVYSNIFDCLLRYYDGKYENVLCKDYSISEDGTEYTFNLKEGVKFHNGETLTAGDVVFSMMRAKESSEMSNFTKNIVKAEAVDDLTVKIVLDQPYVSFLTAVASTVCIMNEKAVNEAGDNIRQMPVGTGPYKFKQWDSGSQVVLERFDDYHDALPQIREANYVVLTNPETALTALQTGEIDMTYTIPPIAVQELKDSQDLVLDLNPTMGSGYIVMNLEAPFLSDPNFRMALAYATNREHIVEVGMDGVAKVSSLLWDERTAGYSGKYTTPEFNLDKAKEYLAKTDYNGEEITFVVGYENYKKIGVVYQEELKQIGVNISVEQLEANTWVSDMKSGNFAMSTIVQTMDPDVDFWSTVFMSSAIGGYNFSRLNDADVDKAFQDGSVCQDPEQRKDIYSVIEKKLYEDTIIIPIYDRVVTCAYNKGVTVDRSYDSGFSTLRDMHWD